MEPSWPICKLLWCHLDVCVAPFVYSCASGGLVTVATHPSATNTTTLTPAPSHNVWANRASHLCWLLVHFKVQCLWSKFSLVFPMQCLLYVGKGTYFRAEADHRSVTEHELSHSHSSWLSHWSHSHSDLTEHESHCESQATSTQPEAPLSLTAATWKLFHFHFNWLCLASYCTECRNLEGETPSSLNCLKPGLPVQLAITACCVN